MGLKQRLIDNKKYIRRFMCREVTTGQLFTSSGVPHPDGLLSPIIFGETPAEKRVMKGFIRLPVPIIHPAVYRGFFKRRMRNIDNIINGTKKYTVQEDGTLLETPTGNTGLVWLYNNFEKIKFKAAQEADEDRILSQKVKTSFNRMTKEDVFIDKFIVCPLILRDISREGGMVKVDELNGMYQSLIQLSQIYSGDSNNILIDRNAILYKIQIKTVQILNYAYDKIFGKDGVQRKKALGRNPEFTSRNIISAPIFTGKFGSSPIDIDRVGYPLSAVVGSFTPLFMFNMMQFFKMCYDMGHIKGITEDEFESYYDMKFCKSLIDKYIKSWSERLQHISASAEKDKSLLTFDFTVTDEKGTVRHITRPVTIIEVFYMSAYVSVEMADRVTAITRYPILNKYNCVVTKIHVLSTRETIRTEVSGLTYPYYPNIFDAEERLKTKDPDRYEELIGRLFHETIKMSNVYLKGFNGDYDKTNFVA